jgi:hypothetical protein
MEALMQARATYDDAKLILELYEMRREDRMRKARAWFSGSFRPKTLDDFGALCPPGSDENASYRMVTTYWEMVASFITSGVLNQELFFQSGRELLLVWERLRDILPALRERNRDPFAYANLETVAQAYINYLDRRSPGTYAAFSARQRG